MRNHVFLKVALLGLLTFALAPGIAGAAGQGQDLTGMLASSDAERAPAIVDPPGSKISVAPASVNFGIVNAGFSSGPYAVRITNIGNEVLDISSLSAPSPFGVDAGGPPPYAVGVGSFFDVFLDFSPMDGQAYADNLTILSDAINGTTFTVPLSGRGNTAPGLVRTPSDASFSISAFQTLDIAFTATDPEGDSPISWSHDNVPLGAEFTGGTTEDGVSMATFHWPTDLSSLGSHTDIMVRAADPLGLYSDSFFDIFVESTNSPPVADHGGPYNGVRTVALTFNGTGSSDPDGNGLSYAWSFGDGSSGTGAMPSHVYASTGTFIVNLTVTDDQAPAGVPPLSNTAPTTADIIDFVPVQVTAKLYGGGIRTHGGGNQAMGLETMPVTNVSPSDIDPTSVRLSAPAGSGTMSQIAPLAKGASAGPDLDGDGLPELLVYFSRDDIAALLSNLPNGANVALTMTATATGDRPVRGTGTFKVKATGGPNAVTSAAAPNPFNPETSISYSLRSGGQVSVRIYSVNGQLVRTLRDEFGTAGNHEVRWNGLDDRGNQVRSGIYFVNVVQGENRSQTKVVVAK